MLSQKVNNLVRQDLGAPEAQHVQVEVKNGMITLRGDVKSEMQKRNLVSQIKALSGVERVDDSLLIVRAE